MDQRQKNIIDSIANELADSIRASELAEFLQSYKFVSRTIIEDVFDRTESNFCRNLRLIEFVKESGHPQAFEDFLRILERLNPDGASKLISSTKKGEKSEGTRSIWGKFFDKFARSPTGQYPLGFKSSSLSTGHASSQTYHSTSAGSSFQNCDDSMTISSPLKEKHQATLICPSSSHDQSQQSTTDNGYRLARRLPDAQSPLTSSTATQSNRTRPQTEGDRRHINKFCQTPTRPTELNSNINDLSLVDDLNDDYSQRSDCGSPVISWHPYAQSSIHEGGSRASSPHRCLPSFSSASSESGESSSDSLIIDPNLILDSSVMTAIAREGPNMMSVKRAERVHNNFDEDYKMTARPRGKCLIVNNINFEDDIFPTRKGSDEDANRFDRIFKEMGFETIMTRNLTADQMRNKFKELSDACRPEHDALFVFILSHGSEQGIYGTDGLEVYLESEIISYFDNRNCKAMIGKPKVFVIQACRGRSKDCGGEGDTTDSVAWAPAVVGSTVRTPTQENRVPASWLPSNQPSDGKRRKHPIRTDMLLIFSCLAGFVSVRNETAGSWLGVALAYFIMTHAHERDLLRILNLVTSDIIQRESSHGHIQSIELKLLGWTKNLYFNPGIYL